jgi:hypothetical protein
MHGQPEASRALGPCCVGRPEQRNGQGFATLGDTKATARIFGDPLTGGMGFSGAAVWPASTQHQQQVVGAPPRPRRLIAQRKQLEGVRGSQSPTRTRVLVLGRTNQRPVSDASKAARGGQRWKVKAVEFTGSPASDELTRQR